MRFELLAILALVGLAVGNFNLTSGQISSTSLATPSNGSIGTTSIIKSKTKTALPTGTASPTDGGEPSTTSDGASVSSSGSTDPNAAGLNAANSFGAFVLAIGVMAAGQLI